MYCVTHTHMHTHTWNSTSVLCIKGSTLAYTVRFFASLPSMTDSNAAWSERPNLSARRAYTLVLCITCECACMVHVKAYAYGQCTEPVTHTLQAQCSMAPCGMWGDKGKRSTQYRPGCDKHAASEA